MTRFLIVMVILLVGAVIYSTANKSTGLSGAEARCYNTTTERYPTGKADTETFMSAYRACVARNR